MKKLFDTLLFIICGLYFAWAMTFIAGCQTQRLPNGGTIPLHKVECDYINCVNEFFVLPFNKIGHGDAVFCCELHRRHYIVDQTYWNTVPRIERRRELKIYHEAKGVNKHE